MPTQGGRIINQEALEERARNLTAQGLNGIKLVFVNLTPAAAPIQADLDLEFHNAIELANIDQDVNVNGIPAHTIFPLSGGVRLMAGSGSGQVRVDQVQHTAGSTTLRLRVRPIGDYSTYTLSVQHANIDPLFSDVAFKFRPGCFNLNCAPVPAGSALPRSPAIDYLAKDFESFKHVLITAMMRRVPGWEPTSEVDLDQVLIDLIAADADELSDFQDRVMNEAYLSTSRKRISLARHARLMDYHIHQGNQANTWLAVSVNAAVTLPLEFGVWSGDRWQKTANQIFASIESRPCDPLLNELGLYTWGNTVTALEAGATSAELALPPPLNPLTAADATILRNLLRSSHPRHLVVEEVLNPETGQLNGRDPRARQIVQLLDGAAAAERVQDPMNGQWSVRVFWRDEDRLTRRFCFVTRCTGLPPVANVSVFRGNLIRITHGRPHTTVFRPPGSLLAPATASGFVHTDEAYIESTPWGSVCTLPRGPLAYRLTPPGGEIPPRTTLNVAVTGFAQPWQEQSDLIESQEDHEDFIVETDEHRVSSIRFGNGVNGRALAPSAVVTCHYRVGDGVAGNVGAETLTGFDRAAHPAVDAVRNPFDVEEGRSPEPPAEIARRVPEAYRARQLRAVTLEDYVRRAEELPQVARAHAAYQWTGSWRTVRVAIDPRGTTELTEPVRLQIEQHLNTVRLIGEDLEIRKALFVPLDVYIKVCAHPEYWPEDLQVELERAFSDDYSALGEPGFFHPDRWTFGQALHVSQLIGRALSVEGVWRVLVVSLRRLNPLSGPSLATITVNPEDVPHPIVATLPVRDFEIIQVSNDPSRLESGRITFDIRGGRQ